ncbi:Phenoloxidase-activating factor 2 (Fragment) [Anthophora plagiata]
MKVWFVGLLGIAVQICATQIPVDGPDWSWQGQDTIPINEPEDPGKSENQENRAVAGSIGNANIEVVDPPGEQRSVESVIEEILVSNRQGRNIEGFDQLYADPEVKNALQLGNDTIARSYIRDKLCSLGLMNCENLEGRRPYYSPHRGIHPQDIIYAQPVTIRPVGRPLPAIPVKRPFGPPRPGPPSGFISSGPPPEVIYGAGGAPHPPSFASSSGLFGSYSSFKKPGPPSSFPLKPVYEGGAISEGFEYQGNSQFIDKKQIALRPSVGSDPVQQHVHHHYHHNEGAAGATIAGGPSFSPGPISQGATSIGYGGNYGSIGTSYDVPSSGVLGGGFQDFDDYKKAFKVKGTNNDVSGSSGSVSANSYADRYPVYEKPPRDFAYGKTEGQKTGKYFTGGNYVSPNAVHASSNDYAASGTTSNNYYNYYGNNNENEGFGNEFSGDCVCVPYAQCQNEHAGRKDDLFLPIDPRNLNKNIEAESMDGTAAIVIEENSNGTSTIVRVPKSSTIDATDAQLSAESIGEESKELRANDRSKREATRDESTSIEGRKKSDGEGRLDASDLDSSKLNLKPTWGISFGLPQTGGSYPISPYGGNVLVNPYNGYGSADQGINLGLVSVNPLLAVQFTKDEYGEKVVKPFVNFHVTPNRNIVQKLGHILSHKKQALFDGYGPNYAPHYYPSKPVEIYQKPYYAKPHHPPHHYTNTYPHEYSDYYRDGDDDYDYDYGESYRGIARSNANETPDADGNERTIPKERTSGKVSFPNRRKRDVQSQLEKDTIERQYTGSPRVCGPGFVCCSRKQPIRKPRPGQCGTRYTQGINGRIKTPSYVDGDAEFGEYPWQVAILKKDPTESVYVCGGTLISSRHILTAAHCVKTYAPRDLRVRLGEWDVNHDVEFYPYIERDVGNVHVHPEFYAGTLYNDIAILRIDHEVDFQKNPHISPACLPDKRDDFTRSRCWTTGWGKDAFGDFGKYQNILKEVDVPVVNNQVCEQQMRRTRLGPSFNLHPGFICAGGEEGKDACKGDGGGPMVCERNGHWQLAGVVSWGIGCGQPGVPGVYARVSYYLDWINQVVNRY